MSVSQRLLQIQTQLGELARAAGRDPAEIRLIAVSKYQPLAAIHEAYQAGQRDFGENYVQELQHKAEALAHLPELRFHLIGHLQRNKAKVVVRYAAAVQSVDNLRLAQELGQRAAELPSNPNRQLALAGVPEGRLPVLVEVNLGGEAQKSGCAPEALAGLLDAVEAQSALHLAGLMTVPPFTDAPEDARPFFDALVTLRERHGGAARLRELSMGMSQDLAQAVAAGATVVRVGTAIFGARPPQPSPGLETT